MLCPDGQGSAEADASIDLIIGNNCKGQILSMVETFMEGRTASEESDEKQVSWLDMNQNCDYESLSITKVSEHTRAYIKIQDGCNQFCSYCIIPYARGRIRSREPEEILSEVSTLAASGYREIVLTGIHISSYGKDFGREDALISLVEKLASIEGVVGSFRLPGAGNYHGRFRSASGGHKTDLSSFSSVSAERL